MLREWLDDLSFRLRALFRRNAADDDLDDEIRFHLEQEKAKNVASGMSPAEAERAARRSFGNVSYLKEETRVSWGISFLESLFQDIRFALRSFRRDPGFTATVLVTLALGIGVITAIFAVVNAVLLQPLPYEEPDRLVSVWRIENGLDSGSTPLGNISAPEFFDLRANPDLFESSFLLNPNRALFTEVGRWLRGGYVDADFCATFGVQPALGRCFEPQDFFPGDSDAIILPYDAWQEDFAGASDIIGRTYGREAPPQPSRKVMVVGVMPKGFHLLNRELRWFSPATFDARREKNLGSFSYWGAGRLKKGLTVQAAQAGADGIARRLASQFPEIYAGKRILLTLLSELAADGLHDPLAILFAAAVMVLLIISANIAGLFLIRSMTRLTEFAIRSAIGASGPRLVRQFLTENVLLSLIGGLAGLAIAFGLVQYVRTWLPKRNAWSEFFLPAEGLGMDSMAALFAIGIALATGLLVGLPPALRGTGFQTAGGLRRGGGGSLGVASAQRTRQWLAISQVTLAVVLTVSAAVLIRAFLTLHHRGIGLHPEGVIGLEIFGDPNVQRSGRQSIQWWEQVRNELRTIPGVSDVGTTFLPPIGRVGFDDEVWRIQRSEAIEAESFLTRSMYASNEYFKMLDIPLIEGRTFDDRDHFDAERVAIINETAASQFWPGQSPIGKVVQSSWRRRCCTVIGVVGDVRTRGLHKGVDPIVYQSSLQTGYGSSYWLIKSNRSPDAVFRDTLQKLHEIDPGITILAPGYQNLSDLVQDSTWQLNNTMILLTGLASLALLVSAVGVYGVLSYTVRQRTREMGLRLALGAERSQVLKMVLRQGLSIAATGVVLGLVAAAGLTRFLGSLLYGVEPLDALTFAGVALVMLAAALLASYIPARRAASVDPMAALRHE